MAVRITYTACALLLTLAGAYSGQLAAQEAAGEATALADHLDALSRPQEEPPATRLARTLNDLAPEAPPPVRLQIAQKFVDESPKRFSGGDFQLQPADTSELLRRVAELSGATAPAEARKRWVTARVAALLKENKGPPPDVDTVVATIQRKSQVAWDLLLTGRMANDALRIQLADAAPAKPADAAKPPPNTTIDADTPVAEVLRACPRANPDIDAFEDVRALYVEGRTVEAGTGDQLEVIVMQMRPNLFRVQSRRNGRADSIIGYDGVRAWRQLPGKPLEWLDEAQLAELNNYRVFEPPYFQAVKGRLPVTRLPDGSVDGHPTFRLEITRGDKSRIICDIDKSSGLETGRELGTSLLVFRDFRDAGGIRLPGLMALGNGSVAVVFTRVATNPGYLPSLFAPPREGEPSQYAFEAMLAHKDAPTKP